MRQGLIPELDYEYYLWLCDLIRADQGRRTYWTLAKTLYLKGFRWSVPNDDNRACEGKNLRERFCDEIGIAYIVDHFPEEVSMLELLIGLAERCESIMDDSPCDRPMHDWFWKILSNVGLDKANDADYDYLDRLDGIDGILERVINRTYRRDGEGGLFPLKKDKKDQRKVELWYQLNAYLVENYYTND